MTPETTIPDDVMALAKAVGRGSLAMEGVSDGKKTLIEGLIAYAVLADRVSRPAESVRDLGRISVGHVCKHGIRHPHACNECDAAAWALHRASRPAQAAGEADRLREALLRIATLTPARANAFSAQDLHGTIKAIAEAALTWKAAR